MYKGCILKNKTPLSKQRGELRGGHANVNINVINAEEWQKRAVFESREERLILRNKWFDTFSQNNENVLDGERGSDISGLRSDTSVSPLGSPARVRGNEEKEIIDCNNLSIFGLLSRSFEVNANNNDMPYSSLCQEISNLSKTIEQPTQSYHILSDTSSPLASVVCCSSSVDGNSSTQNIFHFPSDWVIRCIVFLKMPLSSSSIAELFTLQEMGDNMIYLLKQTKQIQATYFFGDSVGLQFPNQPTWDTTDYSFLYRNQIPNNNNCYQNLLIMTSNYIETSNSLKVISEINGLISQKILNRK